MTELPALLETADLDDRRGGPFAADEVAAACAAVRGECGWHVAPRATRTILVSGPAGPRLVLPSLAVDSVSTIRDVLTGRYVARWRDGSAGMLICDGGWPRGESNLEITLVDGYDRCPDDLVAVVLERARVLAAAQVPGTSSSTRTVGEVTRTATRTDSVVARAPAWSLAAEAILQRYSVT